MFTKTAGYRHGSIPAGVAAIKALSTNNKFDIDTTSDASVFQEDTLAKYAAVIFLNTTDTGDVLLNHYQEAAFERYIQAGGGFVGVHAATDAEYHWGWYGRLIGGYFSSHPDQQEAVLRVVDSTHPSTKHLPKEWKRKDEWYNFKNLSKDVKVLLTIDESSYKGGTNGKYHPMAWYHDFDGGRSFYTELGHTDESYSDPAYLQHLLGGIQYAIGENNELDYAKAKTQPVPEENRFVKTMLTQGSFFEPTEMAILPDLSVLVAQRRGEIMYFNNETKSVKQAGFLNVYHQTSTKGVNAEEGILGLTIDPDFKTNRYVYVFYSPVDTSVNRLSRFEFKGDTIDTRTEKIVLQFHSDREICCHTGGSIAFGKDRMLYLSTGDNSTPFNEPNQPFANHGFAPLDDRPGHEQYDARRTSGNTADLRGKVIRINIKEDGSYAIPAGNLFPGNNPKTRPEIYTMGHRNPYRISVDKKTGFLYWGEVGPDSGTDSLDSRGPRGYDEVNQARKAGYFGWPLLIADNLPYREHDYATDKNGAAFTAESPVNNSRNNSGLQNLPPAEPAFIYYPYAYSKDFPQVGSGGRNAMAGPVYYTADFPKDTRYPEYFNGKLFIYEWMRNWVKLVGMQSGGNFDKMDAFMESTQWNSPIDMEVGPDGRIYVLEYGRGWFAKNPDAGLSRIDYIAGNRPPKVDSLTVAKESGVLPYELVATVKAVDPEGDKLTYRWKIGDTVKETSEPRLQYSIGKAGEYDLSVEVADKEGSVSKSASLVLYAGNEQPQVSITLQGNRSFYFPGKPIAYSVAVADGSTQID
ncbi:MAG: ThuA domain-containing protein, partial [Chitinophagaceae bacterium]